MKSRPRRHVEKAIVARYEEYAPVVEVRTFQSRVPNCREALQAKSRQSKLRDAS